MKEFILCAAIHFQDGKKSEVKGIESGTVICGRRHSDCYQALSNLIGDQAFRSVNCDGQGFITSENRYVSRAEAWRMAKENNQIKFGPCSEFDQMELISENLY